MLWLTLWKAGPLRLALPVAKVGRPLSEVELQREDEGTCGQPSPMGVPSPSLWQQQTQQILYFLKIAMVILPLPMVKALSLHPWRGKIQFC